MVDDGDCEDLLGDPSAKFGGGGGVKEGGSGDDGEGEGEEEEVEEEEEKKGKGKGKGKKKVTAAVKKAPWEPKKAKGGRPKRSVAEETEADKVCRSLLLSH